MKGPMHYFDYRYRVLYADTDQMGITYYANYFRWFEAARTEYFRVLGFPYTECEKKGIYLPVAEAHANYLAPSTYDDDIIVRTSVAEMGNSTLRFEYQVMNANTQQAIATGYSVHVFVNKGMKPCRVPEEIKKVVTVFSLLKKRCRCKGNGPFAETPVK
ncbi:MAG TPA: thioesterase family protein [Candidatus Omnitrophota bacterium]|nr:thioesterase family protein [Candidatus Omnitrophota bacterium]